MNPYTTPFFVNNYILPNGMTSTADNPKETRQASERAVDYSGRAKLNCRIRVTRIKGVPDRSDYEW